MPLCGGRTATFRFETSEILFTAWLSLVAHFDAHLHIIFLLLRSDWLTTLVSFASEMCVSGGDRLIFILSVRLIAADKISSLGSNWLIICVCAASLL